MLGSKGSYALEFIKDHTRDRREYPHDYGGLVMSDDNQILFNTLTLFIQKHVEEKLENHLEDIRKRLDMKPGVQFAAPLNGSNVGQPVQAASSGPIISARTETPLEPPKKEISAMSNTSNPVTSPSGLTQNTAGNAPTTAQSTHTTATSTIDDLEAQAEKAAEEKEMVKINKLRNDILRSENWQAEQALGGIKRKQARAFMSDLTPQKKDNMLDCFVAIIIIINSVVIGISMDHDTQLIFVLNLIFTACFIVELLMKFALHGVVEHFRHIPNVFDFTIVAFDILQLVMQRVDDDALSDAPAASMFRVARLVRLVRLIRLARLNMLDDLVALISGMVGGITTLLWSILLFFMILYITALLFREFFGKTDYYLNEDENMTDYFNSVPRCMFTVFRFFFGDFTTINGTSLFEGIQDHYGSAFCVVICTFFFMITIGLFNVIAAIFVESTLAAANHATIVRKTERMNDVILWSTRVTSLVRKAFEYNGKTLPERLSETLDELRSDPIPEEIFGKYIEDPSVIKLLNDLEIEEADHKYLFDILDNDNTGEIVISQLSDGLERLRGDPRRSDIICVDLMVRSVQAQTDFLVQAAKANVKTSSGNRKKMEENKAALGRIELMLTQLTGNVSESSV